VKKALVLAEFARRVRALRYSLDLTQEQLAEKANLHVNYIGGLERAKRNPSLICIIELAKALKVSPKDLMPE
jgi:transcriptional regulator with XRE-family HTH domain